MTMLLAWFVMAYGFSNIMVYGSIFKGFREGLKKWGNNQHAPFQGVGKFFSDLISCMMCTSTWIGFFLGLFIFSPNYYLFGVNPLISWFFDGLLASGAVWAINSIIEWFEENRPSK
jgi:hypothetical protein